jgi:hypothetical protein
LLPKLPSKASTNLGAIQAAILNPISVQLYLAQNNINILMNDLADVCGDLFEKTELPSKADTAWVAEHMTDDLDGLLPEFKNEFDIAETKREVMQKSAFQQGSVLQSAYACQKVIKEFSDASVPKKNWCADLLFVSDKAKHHVDESWSK